MINSLFDYALADIPLWIGILIVWTLFWKGVGLWNSARRNNFAIFVIFLLVNTAGVLPIAYLIYLKFSKENIIEQIGHKKPRKKKK
jgi:hypothetical protein